MSGYRRFVAYVYEYQKGRKAGNCGFIKVEDRDGRCTMELHLQCPGLTPDVECRIYGFVRRAGLLNGILLGDCRTQAGRIESTVQTDSGDMGGQGVSLREMGGMILQTQNGAFFGTEWDDEPIRPDNFQELTKINEEPSKEEKVMPDTAEEENNSILSGNSIEEPQEPEEPRNLEKLEKTKEPEPHIQERDISETDASKIEVLKDTALKDTVPETVIEETADTEKVESTEQRPPEEKAAGEKVAEEKSTEEKVTEEKPTEARPPEEKPGEACEVFDDGEITGCRKIQPGDLARFNRKDWPLRSNRFLLYGYYNFGHILLGQKADGTWILGVPGGYDQQERFMANMFGFPYFKESRAIRIRRGRGGYWYRSVNPPDLH